MKRLFHYFRVYLFLLLIGCGTRDEASFSAGMKGMSYSTSRSASAPVAEESMNLENVGVPGALTDAAYIQPAPSIATSFQPRTRMVIKTGALNCEVANYENALAQIQQLAAQFGGYVVASSAQVSAEDVKSGSVTLRLEAKNFDAALQTLKQLAKKVESESVQGNDVTEEFYDLTARLENKRKAEKRYQEILLSAKTTKDILEVEQALTNVREEIERMEGRKRFLEDQVSLSTIKVNLHEPYPLVASGQYGFLAKMWRGVEAGISGFSDVLSACVTFVIAGIPIFILLFLVIWIFKKYRRRAKAAQLAKATMAEKKE